MDAKKSKNPWDKKSMEEFRFFCCSKCEFASLEDIAYQNHIAKHHPEKKKFDDFSKDFKTENELKIEFVQNHISKHQPDETFDVTGDFF